MNDNVQIKIIKVDRSLKKSLPSKNVFYNFYNISHCLPVLPEKFFILRAKLYKKCFGCVAFFLLVILLCGLFLLWIPLTQFTWLTKLFLFNLKKDEKRKFTVQSIGEKFVRIYVSFLPLFYLSIFLIVTGNRTI